MRAQLRRLLAHPLFTNSKRYPALLAYTVEQTLKGKAAELKERTIGIEAFGREPDYDANADPVVRIAAAEVRKRLIQYYYDSTHAGELVIELSAGSYVPAFREAEAPAQATASHIETHRAVLEPVRRRRGSARFFCQPEPLLVARRRSAISHRSDRICPWPLPPNFSALEHRPFLGAHRLQPQPDHLLPR